VNVFAIILGAAKDATKDRGFGEGNNKRLRALQILDIFTD